MSGDGGDGVVGFIVRYERYTETEGGRDTEETEYTKRERESWEERKNCIASQIMNEMNLPIMLPLPQH